METKASKSFVLMWSISALILTFIHYVLLQECQSKTSNYYDNQCIDDKNLTMIEFLSMMGVFCPVISTIIAFLRNSFTISIRNDKESVPNINGELHSKMLSSSSMAGQF